MKYQEKIGISASYCLGMAGIGFTLPFLPLYLGDRGLSDQAIGLVSTVAALTALLQFPLGIWSDRVGRRKPFLLVALGVLALATWMLPRVSNVLGLSVLVVLFAENGICRAVVESLTGAEVSDLAARDELGSTLGALRFWKPIGIVTTAFLGGWMAERSGVGSILGPLAVVQVIAFGFALMVRDRHASSQVRPSVSTLEAEQERADGGTLEDSNRLFTDGTLWMFIVSMILFHVANSPGGVYLGLFLKRDLHAQDRVLAQAFILSMIAWMIVVRPAGRLSDRLGRRPLLLVGWAVMSLRLALVAVAQTSWQVVVIQLLDGFANGLFAVIAAAWVTDRLASPRHAGQAQVIVGTCLVLGSALGPALSGMVVDALGYRQLFGMLAAIGAFATLLVASFIPETVNRQENSLSLQTEMIIKEHALHDLSMHPEGVLGKTEDSR